MTNGTVVVLGNTGKNFGAGMTGGVAFILDLNGDFPALINTQLVTATRLESESDIQKLQSLIQQHLTHCGSERAREVLSAWTDYLPKFWKVSPSIPTAQPIPEPLKEPEATGTVINENVIAAAR
jgi:glutamate synthase domain-containing protein 3